MRPKILHVTLLKFIKYYLVSNFKQPSNSDKNKNLSESVINERIWFLFFFSSTFFCQ